MTKYSLESRWDSLTPDPLKPVFQLIDSSHPLALYIGRDTEGNRLLLLVTAERPASPKQMRAIRVEIFEREDGNWSLLIRLVTPELTHVFALLCSDLVEAAWSVPKADAPVAFVMKRLALWQRLLERTGSGLLSDSEVRGLVGELTFLLVRMIPSLGLRTSVASWVGPAGADQDFQEPEAAWEVKTIRADVDAVWIASEMQLHSSARSLGLVVIRLDEREAIPGVFTLNMLVKEARRLLLDDTDAMEQFERRLVEVGYLMRPEYDRPFFSIGWMRLYEIRDEFPRLVPAGLPTGVRNTRYELTLAACEPFLVESLNDVRPIHGA